MNQIVVTLVVILLPGVIAAIITDAITIHKKWGTFRYGLYSLVLGLFSYALLQIAVYAYDLASGICSQNIILHKLGVWEVVFSANNSIASWEEVFSAVIASIPVALAASWIVNHKIANKFAQSWKIGMKYGDENLFSYYLNAKEIDWIYIRSPEQNITYQGRIVSSSENDSIQEVVLSEVSIYRYDDSVFLYSVPTLYLARKAGEFIIEAIPPENLGENI